MKIYENTRIYVNNNESQGNIRKYVKSVRNYMKSSRSTYDNVRKENIRKCKNIYGFVCF